MNHDTTNRIGRFFGLSFAVAAVVTVAAAGCAPEDDVEESMDDEALGEASSPICLFPPAPAYDTSRTLAVVNDFEEVISPSGGYGNGDCDYYGVRFVNGDRGRVRPYELPTNETDCEASTVTAKFYTRTSSTGAWTYQSSSSQSGVWSGGACTNLSVSVNPPGWTELLVIGQVREVHSGGSFIAAFNRRVSITGWSPNLN